MAIQGSPARPRRAARWIAATAGTAATALVVTLAIVWPGFDAQQTPLDDGAVWALQSGDGRRYAKVNTELRELETVKEVEAPNRLAQTAGHVFVFTEGLTKVADVNLAAPVDLDADAADTFTSTPSGTRTVAASDDYLAYLTDSGDVYGARMSGGGATVAIDPFADTKVADGQEPPRLRADAVAVTSAGILYAVSRAQQLVVTARADTGEILARDPISVPDTATVSISAAGADWIVADPDDKLLWVHGRADPLPIDVDDGARLQKPATTRDTAYLADTRGLVAVALDGSGSTRIVEASGTAATPMEFAGTMHAAWLGADSGTLWSAADGESPLDYGTGRLGPEVSPEFAVNGARAILNETSSGWVWTVPDGALVSSSQSWDSDRDVQRQQTQQQQAERVIDPRPPVAEPDDFGVRAGRDVALPVLLNDHDPNDDVLSIVPSAVTGLDPAFGSVRLADRDQRLVASISPGATGSTTFTYQITDGTSADGLTSPPASVTLTVVPDDVNRAPVWCGTSSCLATWPSPQVAPGGTTSVDVLDGWVDPDGDPIYVASAVNETGVGSVTVDPAGKLTYQHPDPNATAALEVEILVTVSDSRGATAQKTLTVSVTSTPQLTADAFAATGVTGLPLTVDVTPHVGGANGAVTLSSAKTLAEGAGSVTTNPTSLSFVFRADKPGPYVIQYSVRDQAGTASSTVRITLIDPAAAQISAAPLTAFVRPNEDASVDVLSAVDNPGGLVLLVSDLRPEPTPASSLSVATVGQNLIRVSGSTGDGRPGSLGTIRYTVSDGSGTAGASTTGEVTVILLASPSAEPPIAVDDAVTVRAGTQVDIPVLENDTAPAGGLLAIDASKIVNESNAGLAFATPQVVRYLAPSAAGTYSLSYTIYRAGFPEVTDTARVFITVLPAETNSAPVPNDLVGRVLSGSRVSIPFDGFGVDPDGDAVSLDRVVSQPAHGSAAISADGDAIVYTSTPGSSGQDSFTYQVRDALGATGTAAVRIGILNAQSDPSPVTYSDYAQAQAGASSEVVVHPLENDVDPAGRALELVEVRPNAPSGSAEYAALQAMIAATDLTAGAVRLRGGTELGTYSFVYTVRNRTGDTAQGLIVLKVVRSAVPDFPVVRDTALTADTVADLQGGVDVLSGKVSWTGGDVSSLTLTLWDDSSGFRVDGWKISGSVRPAASVVPFQVRGTSFSGADVVSYGFLRVPGQNDIPLTLRPSFDTVEVNENSSVDIDMAKAVSVPRGAVLQVASDGLAAGGARAAGTCALVSGTTVRYTAGAGAPWSDVCTVPVKLATQDHTTYLAVRIDIIAAAPQPELRPASLSVSPGATATYDLTSMTIWQGQNDTSTLTYGAGYSGDQFDIVQNGSQLTVTAKDASRPGRQEPVTVTLTNRADAAPATLTLTVGPAPSTLPKGGSATRQCSQSGGNTSCAIQVIGVGGEQNPLPGTPLVLAAVTGPSNCPGVTFTKADDRTVTASWTADAAGAGDCAGSFVVQDAQLRQSSGDRNGTIILDLQGLPANPTRVNWTGYTGTSVTLRVVSQASSYPAVTGYRVSGGGQEVTCSASGECPPIPARNGDQVTYQAWAINAVGESRGSVSLTAWAYERPAAPTLSAQPVPNPANDGKTATVTVSSLDPSTGKVTLRSALGATRTMDVASGQASVVFDGFDVGANVPTTITATPSTRFPVPPDSVVAGGSAEGYTASITASGIGRPIVGSWQATASDDDSGSIAVTADFLPNGDDAQLRVSAVIGATCTPSTSIPARHFETVLSAPVWSTSRVTLCAEYVRGGVSFGAMAPREANALPTGLRPKPAGDATYTISTTPTSRGGGSELTWNTITAPTLSAPLLFQVLYSAAGASRPDFSGLFTLGVNPGAVTARSCVVALGSTCSDPIAVTPTALPYTAQVVFPSTCTSGTPHSGSEVTVRAERADAGAPTASVVSTTEAGVETVRFSVTFTGNLAALGTQSYDVTCSPPRGPANP